MSASEGVRVLRELAGKLSVHEERMAFLFDMIVGLRDKQTDPELRKSLNSMKYVLSGRPDCVAEITRALPALCDCVEAAGNLRHALKRMSDNIAEFGTVTDGIYFEDVWTADDKLGAALSSLSTQEGGA